jgi:hypothetical protein
LKENLEGAEAVYTSLLTSRHLARLHHGSILLLESLAQSLAALEILVDASHHTAFLSRDDRFGGEVVDAVIEAALDEAGIGLSK